MVHTNMIFLCARLTKRVIRPDLIPSFAWPTLIFFVRPKKCPIRRKESSVLISSHPVHGPEDDFPFRSRRLRLTKRVLRPDHIPPPCMARPNMIFSFRSKRPRLTKRVIRRDRIPSLARRLGNLGLANLTTATATGNLELLS